MGRNAAAAPGKGGHLTTMQGGASHEHAAKPSGIRAAQGTGTPGHAGSLPGRGWRIEFSGRGAGRGGDFPAAGPAVQPDFLAEPGCFQHLLHPAHPVPNEYLMEGGFPETMDGSLDKAAYTKALLNTIIQKDIRKRYKVRYPASLQQVADTVIDNFCQEINFENIRETYAIRSVQTVKNYVSYLSNAYLARILHKYSFKSMERQSNQKVYIIDNAFLSNRDNSLQTENLGWRLENCIAIELLRRQKYADEQLYYLRESNRYEVDFVRTQANKVIELVQVTYDFSNPSTKLFNREVGGLTKAAKKTHCDNLTLIVMYGETGTIEHGGKMIHVVSAADWLVEKLA